MAAESPYRLAAIWGVSARLSTAQLKQARLSGVEERRADGAARKDYAQSLGVGRHLGAVGGRNLLDSAGHSAGLEIDHRHPLVLDQQPIDGSGDDPAVRKGRG